MSTIKKPRIGATIAKIAAGLIFIDIGIAPDPEFEAGARGVSIIIGLAIIAWAFIPYFKWNKRHKEVQEEIKREEQEIREIRQTFENRSWTCPHCGANTKGKFCEYCGSPYKE